MAKVALVNKPGVTNWVEKYDALPKGSWIRRAAEHLRGKGMPTGQAIATAKNAAAKMCATGDTNFPGLQQVNPGSRAEACAAVAAWDAARARAKADMSIPVEDRKVIDLAFAQVDREAELLDLSERYSIEDVQTGGVIELARPGLVQVAVKVRSKSGKVFTRRMWVRPNQAKALKEGKKPARLSEQGAKVTREQTQLLRELGKIPAGQRPKGWERLVTALVDPRHGGRLGPEKRRMLRSLEEKAPAGSPLRKAATAALKADVPDERQRKARKRKQVKRAISKALKGRKAKRKRKQVKRAISKALKGRKAKKLEPAGQGKSTARTKRVDPAKRGKGAQLVMAAMRRVLDLASPPTVAERKKAPTAYGTSFPIRNREDLRKAVQAYGRAPEDKRALLRKFILSRAKTLGAMELVPDAWKS